MAAVLLAADTVASAAVEQRSLDAFTAELGERIVDLMDDYDVPGVTVALVRDGAPVWSDAYGYADVDARRPMTIDAVNMAVHLQAGDGVGVMRLVQQQRLGLDDPVRDHLTSFEIPESAFAEDDITVRQLLSHRAGMPLGTIGVDYLPGGEVPSLEEHLSLEARLVGEPGSTFLYSNPGFYLLDLLVEDVTGEPFAAYMDARC